MPVDLNGTFEFDSDVGDALGRRDRKNVVWVLPDAGWRTFFLGGYRFFWLGDDIAIMTASIEPVGGPFAGSRIEIIDQFDTENQFHGGEIGLQTELATGPWSIGILTKVALGNNRQKFEIEGRNHGVQRPGHRVHARRLVRAALQHRQRLDDEFAVLPEASAQLGLPAHAAASN